MDYNQALANQALARTTQMHIQIGIKGYKITSIYDLLGLSKWTHAYDICIKNM